jgi:hypothetical protein
MSDQYLCGNVRIQRVCSFGSGYNVKLLSLVVKGDSITAAAWYCDLPLSSRVG